MIRIPLSLAGSAEAFAAAVAAHRAALEAQRMGSAGSDPAGPHECQQSRGIYCCQNARRKPPNAGKGRKAGVPNKTTGLLKEAILAAAERRAARRQGKRRPHRLLPVPGAQAAEGLCPLLGRVLPMQLTSDPDNPGSVVFQTVYEQRPEG
jgi:hypothetical protein